MNVAFIPVRGGSKSIPLKNVKEICGKPLVYWVAKAACECKYIDKVYIATDSKIIKDTILSFCSESGKTFEKIEVIGRSEESASDTASTELAMLEFANCYDFTNIVLIQATSPLLVADDLDNGFVIFNINGTDSVLSAVRQKRFNWNIDENGDAIPTNYDVFHRPRRQDFDGYFVENGAFYITSKKSLLESHNRISGNIKISEMNENSFFEIDEPSDFEILEKLMHRNFESKPDFNEIKMVLTDCDGCLTDGGMYYSEKGDELKKFNTRDGMAFSILKKKKIFTGLITGENVELNKRRVEKMQLDIYIPNCKDKYQAIKKICSHYNISKNNVAYVGDDINDIEALRNVGYSCCPSDACEAVKKSVKHILNCKGGEGVIRELTSLLV